MRHCGDMFARNVDAKWHFYCFFFKASRDTLDLMLNVKMKFVQHIHFCTLHLRAPNHTTWICACFGTAFEHFFWLLTFSWALLAYLHAGQSKKCHGPSSARTRREQEIHRNSIWLGAQSHMTSQYIWQPPTILHDSVSVLIGTASEVFSGLLLTWTRLSAFPLRAS